MNRIILLFIWIENSSSVQTMQEIFQRQSYQMSITLITRWLIIDYFRPIDGRVVKCWTMLVYMQRQHCFSMKRNVRIATSKIFKMLAYQIMNVTNSKSIIISTSNICWRRIIQTNVDRLVTVRLAIGKACVRV